MPKSKAEIAKYARGWRKENYLEKRFNKPLREFLEIKYRDTYNEYCWFFRSLNEKHPDSKDLTKTKTFKEWKRRQLNCQSSDDEPEQSEAETGPNEPEQSEVETGPNEPEQSEVETGPNEPEQSEVETGPNETEQSEAESDHPVSDILSVAINETLPPDNNIDNYNIDNIIQQVINELEQDEAIRHLLNHEEFVHPHYQYEDEGIELDVETELEAVIEPFDYQLEVEGVDY